MKDRERVKAAWRKANQLTNKMTTIPDPHVINAIAEARRISKEEELQSWRDDGVLASECEGW